MKRLNLWDFDGVLALSESAVAQCARRFPDVPFWKWWHAAGYSSRALHTTRPRMAGWDWMASLPGHHHILTAREGMSVQRWLDRQAIRIATQYPPGSVFVRGVHSTSQAATKSIPAALKKARIIAAIVDAHPELEVHFFDDSLRNIVEARKVLPPSCVHHV